MPSGRADLGDFLLLAKETGCSPVPNRNSVGSHCMFTCVVCGMCHCRMCWESNCEGDN